MSVFSIAVFNRMNTDATLTDLLATYNANPAIFTSMPIPDDADLPYIVTEGEVSNSPYDFKGSGGREIVRDIRCYTDNTGSSALVESIAERVRALFHDYAMSVTGFDDAMIMNASVGMAPEETDVSGRIVTITFNIMES